MSSSPFWRQRSVFVTGCTGLLGSWLTRDLVARGAWVTGLVRDWVPRSTLILERVVERINVVRGCLEDYYTLLRALNEYEVDTVFHLGAQTIVGIANNNPLSTFETNIKGTWNLLEACRQVKWVKRVVIASSDKAYGGEASLPYDEETPLLGYFPYDVSKSCADLIATSFYRTHGLPVCITRCGNFYGGGDLNFNRVVPGTIRSALHNEPPRVRSDGQLTRDYFYVKDAAAAYLLLAEKMEELNLAGEAFNFSNERPLSVVEMVELILSLMGRRSLRPIILNEAKNEIPHQYLSAQKARRILQWQPAYSLEAGLTETIEWYKEFFARSA